MKNKYDSDFYGTGVFMFVQDPEASYDFNSKDTDPMPRPTGNDENRYGETHACEACDPSQCSWAVYCVPDNDF